MHDAKTHEGTGSLPQQQIKKRRRWDIIDDSSSSQTPNTGIEGSSINKKVLEATSAAQEAAERINKMLEQKGLATNKPKDTEAGLSLSSGSTNALDNPFSKTDYFSSLPVASPGQLPKQQSMSTPIQNLSSIKDPLFDHDNYFKVLKSTDASGLYYKNIDINDSKHRFILMKKDTQEMIYEKTGSKVETKGKYYPSRVYIESEPPLYLQVSSSSEKDVILALELIKNLVQQALAAEGQRPQVSQFGQYECKIAVGFESERGFNVRSKIVGLSGANVKHINAKTRAKIQIRGKGSAYLEPPSNEELREPMFLHLTGPTAESIESAKKLCEDLIDSVKTELETFKRSRPVAIPSSHSGVSPSYLKPTTYNSAPSNNPPSLSSSYSLSDSLSGHHPSAVDYYAAYYQYYASIAAAQMPALSTEAMAADPNAALFQQQQQHQYAAYYATMAASAAATPSSANTKDDPYSTYSYSGVPAHQGSQENVRVHPIQSENKDPLQIEDYEDPKKDYRSVPPPPNLYK